MKKLISILLAALLLISAAAFAETRITVSGTGQITVEADSAIVSLGVSVEDADVHIAQQNANESIAAIRAALTEFGIPAEDINTDNIMINPSYSWDGTNGNAYSASSTLAIRVSNIDMLGDVIDIAFAAGANTLNNNISYSSDKTDEAKHEALTAAVSDAKIKADVLAQAAGLSVTGIESISESYSYSSVRSAADFTMNKTEDASATVVQSAGLIVTSEISVTCIAE